MKPVWMPENPYPPTIRDGGGSGIRAAIANPEYTGFNEDRKETALQIAKWLEQECLNPEHGGLILGHSGRLHKHCSFCMEQFQKDVVL